MRYNEEGHRYNGSVGIGAGKFVQRPRIGVVRAGTSVLTASRVEGGSGFVRVMGPGQADVKGMHFVF